MILTALLHKPYMIGQYILRRKSSGYEYKHQTMLHKIGPGSMGRAIFELLAFDANSP